jgi:glutamate carboxypeptidase
MVQKIRYIYMNNDGVQETPPDVTERLVARLARLVALESPSGDRVALGAVTDEVATSLVALGGAIRREEHETGDHAVVRFAGTPGRELEDAIVLLLHVDTVWPVGQLQSMPWSHEAGIIRGPGVFDMKGGIVVLEEALSRAVLGSHRPFVVVLVADEEVGSSTGRSLIESEASSARAVLGFEPPHPDGALKTARWGSTRLRIDVTGREAHAALDAAAGVSAIDELVDQLIRVRAIVDGVDGVLANVGVVHGGTRTNVVAGHASAEIGLRFRDQQVETELLAALTSPTPVRGAAEVSVAILSNRPAWQQAAVHDELLADIAEVGEATGQSVDGRPTTGAADTNFTGRLGVPSIDGLGPVGLGAHAVTEQIVVASLAERAALVAAILTGL